MANSEPTHFKSTVEKFNNNVWGYHFPVPEEIARKYIEGSNRRVRCTVNGQIKLQSALMGSATGWFILLNKPTVDKHGFHVGSAIEIQIEKDHSEYGMDVPEELSVLLEQDPDGEKFFNALTPGKQRNLIYLVNKVKNTNSRLNKALAIVHHLKEVNGKLDFKLLNQTIKEYNQRGKLH